LTLIYGIRVIAYILIELKLRNLYPKLPNSLKIYYAAKVKN
jgi:hypothetical protein